MAGNPQVLGLLEQMLDTGKTPEEVCRDCPELLGEVRRRWQDFCDVDAEVVALVPGLRTAPHAGPTAPEPSPAGLPQVPGYEVEAVLGHGGMGVVYKARHLRLNRPVALKMLLNVHAGGHELARFQREAEAAARLRHPNIVQVYDVGDHEGRPYYTMELVEGGSLAQKLAGTPQPARVSAALVATLGEAIGVLHQGGIIHRDLKPANVLLASPVASLASPVASAPGGPPGADATPLPLAPGGPRGADATPVPSAPGGPRGADATPLPKITDFGLARWLEGGPGLTRSGALLGTPNYMAPEQAQGKTRTLGPAVDIYALGAILYELLTGRPPFRAETVTETLLQVIADEPVPPSRRNPKVPRDLETVCLKCLHKEPGRRYPSAAALADDLQRFLRGEAILARPEGRWERLARGARRRPALVVGLTASVVLAVAVVGGGLWLHTERSATEQARAQLARLDQARRDQEFVFRLDAIHLNRSAVVDGRFYMQTNKTRADQEYASAFREAGLGEVHDEAEVVAERLAASPIRTELVAALDDWSVCAADKRRQRWLLEVAQLADQGPTGSRKRLRDPAAWQDRTALGKLTATALAEKPSVRLLVALGERFWAEGGDAVGFLKQVQQEHPGDFWANCVLATALLEKNPTETIRYFQAALAVRPDSAVVHNNLGCALLVSDRPDEALHHFRQALRISPGYADALNSLGYTLKAKGQLDRAIDHYQEALRIDPNLAEAHTNLGVALQAKGQRDKAIAHFEQAIRIKPRLDLAHANLGIVLAEAGRLDAAIDHYQTALKINPNLTGTHINLGIALRARGRPDDAVIHFREALRIDPRHASAHNDLGLILAGKGQLADAIDHFKQALKVSPQLAATHFNLGLALKNSGRLDEAIHSFQQAVQLAPRLAQAHGALGQSLLAVGRFREAQAATRRCLDLLPPDHPLRPGTSQQQQLCDYMLALEARLPTVLQGKDRPADATQRLQFANICAFQKRYAAAAQLRLEAFAAAPQLADNLDAAHRYNAACAAALAGCGQGADGSKLSEVQRERWRKQARQWLEADLAAWTRKLEAGPAATRERARRHLMHWRSDPDLAGLREPSALEAMSADERKEWLALWKEVAAILGRGQPKRESTTDNTDSTDRKGKRRMESGSCGVGDPFSSSPIRVLGVIRGSLPEGAIARLGKVQLRDTAGISSIAFSPDGKFLATGSGQVIRLWQTTTWQELRQLAGQVNGDFHVGFSSDSKSLTSCGRDGIICFWDTTTGKSLRRIDHRGLFHQGMWAGISLNVRISPDEKTLVWGDYFREDLSLIDLVTGKELRIFRMKSMFDDPVIVYSPDGRIIAATKNNRLYMWEVATGRELFYHPRDATPLCFSPDGLLLATGGDDGRFQQDKGTDRVVYLREVATGKLVGELPLPGDDASVRSLAFSSDGSLLSVARGLEVGVWDVPSRRKLRSFLGHRKNVGRTAFSPDGKRLVSASADATALVWDLTDLPGEKARRATPDARKLRQLWEQLKDPDGLKVGWCPGHRFVE